MCGFAGFLDQGSINFSDWPALLENMGSAIAHRGPDDAGHWTDADAGIGLVHRRLSIVDLSPAGHQPMVSASGRYVIAFNGEIYNHQNLRAELSKVGADTTAIGAWRGHSDTETMLAGFDCWGIERTLKQCVGMFAFAVWDKQSRELLLARDRLGEKPLYYGVQNGVLLFGSELKALKVHPSFIGEIDRDAISLQMRHSYIPAPFSIYRGIRKLPAGSLLRVNAGTALGDPTTYWSLDSTIAATRSQPFTGSDSDAVNALEKHLLSAVALQMQADVPLGAFLSGGVDSSTIVALMQAQSARPVKTFTVGFDEAGYNEAVYAKAVARHLGTEHTELYVSPQQALDVIPKLPRLYDEPFSDSSQIPTFLVSQMTRQHVTVSLSGDGGDELFGGYSRYHRAAGIWRKLSLLPDFARAGLAEAIRSLPVSAWNRLAAPILPMLPVRTRNIGDKAHKFAALLEQNDRNRFYQGFMWHWESPDNIVLNVDGPPNYFNPDESPGSNKGYFESMMLADTLNYLPDDILVKLDRAAMGVSLETRVPMLDHRVVEFAWRLPFDIKVRNGQGKWILRQVLDRYVPRELMERPKMGFGVPIDSWLRGPLRDWAESLLDESRLRREGFFNPAPIRQKWDEHLSGQRNWQYLVWDVLMFQAWLEQEQEK
jgi:asparagine synthase (glutamine-hydrolysing)